MDGTLLDPETYSYREALPALRVIEEKGIPLVFCSSKTRKEQEFYRQQLAIRDPFIVEDGGAVIIPDDYFPFAFSWDRSVGLYRVIELGESYSAIRKNLREVVRETGLKLSGYGDMTVEEVMEKTGLDFAGAKRAREREYEETVVTELTPAEFRTVSKALEARGLTITRGGKGYGVAGSSGKGRAISILADLFRRRYGPVWTVGLGDSQNDVSLLEAVHAPVLVQKPGNRWEAIEIPGLYRVRGVGPSGWNRAILSLFSSRMR